MSITNRTDLYMQPTGVHFIGPLTMERPPQEHVTVELDLRPEEWSKLQKAVEAEGRDFNSFVRRAISDEILITDVLRKGGRVWYRRRGRLARELLQD